MKLHVLILIIVFTFQFSFSQNCADTTNIYTFMFSGQKYEIVKEAKTWQDASTCAVERGGILAEINSKAEQDTIFFHLGLAGIDPIQTNAPDGGNAAYVWIGGNDLEEEGKWLWNGDNDESGFQFWQGTSSGNAVNDLFSNWGNEPDNFNNQDGLGLAITNWPLGVAGQWNDVDDSNTLFFVVEYGSRSAKINKLNYNYEENLLEIHTIFSDTFDSLHILINDYLAYTEPNISNQDSVTIIPVINSKSMIYNIVMKVYFDGYISFVSQSSIDIFSFQNPQSSYVNDFESGGTDDFMGDHYTIEKPFGFQNKAIHSKHNYEVSTNHSFTLTTPIIVSETNANMSWAEVAVIQPGDSGAVFGDPMFYDYAIIEGSKTPNEWIPLVSGYDATAFTEWENAWNSGGSYRKLFKTRTIDLADNFSTGDTILIRFRLFSDEAETGWGWIIDSLQIQEFPLSIGDKIAVPKLFSLKQNYPNPFNPTTTITYFLPKSSTVSLKIYNTAGQQIRALINSHQSSGRKTVVWNGENNKGQLVPSGLYIYEIITEDFRDMRKAILLK